jgi:transposase/glycosyltransferase involved in cell wall biosynthesis
VYGTPEAQRTEEKTSHLGQHRAPSLKRYREEPLMDLNGQPESIQHTMTFDKDITEKRQIISHTLPVQQAVLVVPEHERKSYPTDLTDAQWQRIVPLLPPDEPKGRQNGVDLREVINGILYVDCDSHDWQSLPHDLPPRKTVYHYFRLWRRDGTWQKILDALHHEGYEADGHKELPGATPWNSGSGEPQANGLLSEKDDIRNIATISDDLTVVIPTRNERDNMMPLLHALREALDGMRAEILFVDDSDDDTPEVIQDASVAMEASLFHVHVEHREPGIARAGGLATAVVAGLNRAQAAYVAVLDADLQHPPEQLRVLYDQAVAQQADLVVASRYIQGGSYGGLAGVGRRWISVGLKWTAKLLFPERLLRLSDPLGGFFLLRRSLLAEVSLRPLGYKILLELLLRCPWRHVLEVPYHFQARAAGQSKATMQQGVLALRHMLRLWREVPAAGRLWKIGLLLLLNVLITLILFKVNTSFSWAWTTLTMVVIGVMACLDFVLFNRFLFPSPTVTSRGAPYAPALVSIDDGAKVEPPLTQNGSTNGSHPRRTQL